MFRPLLTTAVAQQCVVVQELLQGGGLVLRAAASAEHTHTQGPLKLLRCGVSFYDSFYVLNVSKIKGFWPELRNWGPPDGKATSDKGLFYYCISYMI